MRSRVEPRQERPTLLPGAFLLLAATFAAYAPAIGAGFIWDDDHYVEHNVNLRTPNGLISIWLEPRSLPQYYPLVHTSFWLEYRLWRLDPRGYHLTNVLLHALAAVVLWRVARRLELPGAYLAGALFALHPVAVESVAWITERKNTLSTLLYLLAAFVLLPLFRDESSRHPRRRYLGGALLFVGALLSKTVAASLPAALLVVEWWRHGRVSRRALLLTVPLLALGIGAGLTTAWLERHHVGAVTGAFDLGLAERTLIAGRAVWFYAAKLVWPFGLSFVYPRWAIDPKAAEQWVYPIAAVAAVLALLLLRRRLGRGPLTTALLFGGTLFPALGFVDVYPMKYSFVADHFQYLAMLAPLAAGAALLTRLAAPLPARIRRLLAIALALLLGSLTLGYVQTFHDRETLWRHTLTRNPTSALARANLGGLLIDRAAALATDDRAAAATLLAEAEQHLAVARLHAVDRFDAAAIERNLGHRHLLGDQLAAAINAFRRSLALNPWDVHAHVGLGDALARSGDIEAARAAYDAALAIDPANASARERRDVAPATAPQPDHRQ